MIHNICNLFTWKCKTVNLGEKAGEIHSFIEKMSDVIFKHAILDQSSEKYFGNLHKLYLSVAIRFFLLHANFIFAFLRNSNLQDSFFTQLISMVTFFSLLFFFNSS